MIISSDIADTFELITDGKTGMLYKLRAAEILFNQILALIQDRDRMKRISLEGQNMLKICLPLITAGAGGHAAYLI